MKTAKKKTAKAVKKGSPASRGPKAGGAPLRLEVGKEYENADGSLCILITSIDTSRSASWRAEGKVIRGSLKSFGAYWYGNGLYHPAKAIFREGWLDLVREVPRPKGAK